MITLAIMIFVLLLFIILFIGMYNKLIRLRNRWKNAFAQIDVLLKRRYDLIPNLVGTAKAYLRHEKETLENVIKAINQAVLASNNVSANPNDSAKLKTLIVSEGTLSSAMSRLMVVFEKYPNLKANQTISQLMEELSSTENQISYARMAYNDCVTQFNTICETFPNLLVAKPLRFKEAVLFEVNNWQEREAYKVKF